MFTLVVPGLPLPMPQGKVVFSQELKRFIKVQPPDVVKQIKDIRRMAGDELFQRHSAKEPLYDCPVLAGFGFFRPRPLRVEDRDSFYPCQRPDWENYAELAADALSGLVYPDDSYIVGHLGWPFDGKQYCGRNLARTEIYVVPLLEWSEVRRAELLHDWRKRHEDQDSAPRW